MSNEMGRMRRALKEARFLVERLNEYPVGDDIGGREFFGHISPSVSRLDALLAALSPALEKE